MSLIHVQKDFAEGKVFEIMQILFWAIRNVSWN